MRSAGVVGFPVLGIKADLFSIIGMGVRLSRAGMKVGLEFLVERLGIVPIWRFGNSQ